MKNILIINILFLLSITIIKAQITNKNYENGELIAQFKNTASLENFLITNSNIFELKESVVSEWNIYLLAFDTTEYDALELVEKFQYTDPNLIYLQLNRLAQQRNDDEVIPDDQFFNNQWALKNDGSNNGLEGADIKGTLAWAKSQGGVTENGDTVVVAVIDGDFFIEHPDLSKNMWKNNAEIPGNGIDDDNNGYIDDYHGWNANNNTPLNNMTGFGATHGTHVAGIIGAQGNNNIGISGINWNVKILPIRGNPYNEANVVRAYKYVYDLRKRYNDTNGAEGAFVVATNSSFGRDREQPEDFPLWCGMYDSLGMVGVLSCGATANRNFNIDNTGDIPTACPSPYLISVTNTNRRDQKNQQAGFGKNTIELGAPGTDVFSTYSPTNFNPNNFYSNETGTSMATPYVAGSIGLLYNYLCKDLIDIATEKPDSLALIVKKLILDNVDTINGLTDITVTNGRLNAYKPMVGADVLCEQIAIEKAEAAEKARREEILANLEDDEFQFFPNPVNKENPQIKIRFKVEDENEKIVINLIDFSGKVILSEELISEVKIANEIMLDLGFLSAGNYFLHYDKVGIEKPIIKKLIVF